jgi:hypothetical protein
MKVGDKITVAGYVTQEKFIAGRDLRTMEQILGFQPGRFQHGVWIMRLDRLPGPAEFDLAAYSMIAEHRFHKPADLNIAKLKQMAREKWSLSGGDRLVKVRPATPHDPGLAPDQQYPPGLGAPQWKLIAPVPATVIAEVTGYPNGVFRP